MAGRREPASTSARSLPPTGIRGRLLLLITCALVPMLLLQSWTYFDRFRSAEAQELRAEAEIARSVAHDFQTYVADIERQERTIGQALVSLQPAGEAREDELLTSDRAQFFTIQSLSWLDPHGRVLASSAPEEIGRELGGEPFLRSILAGGDAALGELQTDPASGKATFCIAHGIRRGPGPLEGIVLARINPELLGRRALPLRRQNGGVYTLFDPAGRVVYRRPEGELTPELRERWRQEDPLLQQVLRTGVEQVGVFALPIGEVQEWLSARTPVADTGWVVGTGRPRSVALAPVWSGLRRDALLLVLLDLLVFAAALVISRTISEPLLGVARDARKTRTGQLTGELSPWAPAEVRELRGSLDAMAEKLRARHEELHRALDARDEMLAVVSHDLRNPLGAIKLNAAQLVRQGHDDERVAQKAERIRRASERMEQLIQDLLDVTRLENAGMQLDIHREDASQLVHEAVEMLRPLAAEKQISIDVDSRPERCCSLPCDHQRIVQVFSNLLGNAVKFTPEGGHITVRVREDERRVRFAVSDTGPGIREEERAHIFERFWQPRQASKKGLGLGLFISKGIVEGHGGRLWVESEPGQGATFLFDLPKADAAATSSARSTE